MGYLWTVSAMDLMVHISFLKNRQYDIMTVEKMKFFRCKSLRNYHTAATTITTTTITNKQYKFQNEMVNVVIAGNITKGFPQGIPENFHLLQGFVLKVILLVPK